MKKYLLFAGDHYYPQGGWGDFRGDFDHLEDLSRSLVRLIAEDREKSKAGEVEPGSDISWWHAVDTEAEGGASIVLTGEDSGLRRKITADNLWEED